ncbi:collagen alpha-1(I) chain-like [Meles meles]|uniref:collagen alpha-1(I) chain-like n=1 Tax=Meles meles TaxID=9662 RepID=UPI001E698EC7|nr:collagen alpha-1(I) chain-like [Meles meles]
MPQMFLNEDQHLRDTSETAHRNLKCVLDTTLGREPRDLSRPRLAPSLCLPLPAWSPSGLGWACILSCPRAADGRAVRPCAGLARDRGGSDCAPGRTPGARGGPGLCSLCSVHGTAAAAPAGTRSVDSAHPAAEQGAGPRVARSTASRHGQAHRRTHPARLCGAESGERVPAPWPRAAVPWKGRPAASSPAGARGRLRANHPGTGTFPALSPSVAFALAAHAGSRPDGLVGASSLSPDPRLVPRDRPLRAPPAARPPGAAGPAQREPRSGVERGACEGPTPGASAQAPAFPGGWDFKAADGRSRRQKALVHGDRRRRLGSGLEPSFTRAVADSRAGNPNLTAATTEDRRLSPESPDLRWVETPVSRRRVLNVDSEQSPSAAGRAFPGSLAHKRRTSETEGGGVPRAAPVVGTVNRAKVARACRRVVSRVCGLLRGCGLHRPLSVALSLLFPPRLEQTLRGPPGQRGLVGRQRLSLHQAEPTPESLRNTRLLFGAWDTVAAAAFGCGKAGGRSPCHGPQTADGGFPLQNAQSRASDRTTPDRSPTQGPGTARRGSTVLGASAGKTSAAGRAQTMAVGPPRGSSGPRSGPGPTATPPPARHNTRTCVARAPRREAEPEKCACAGRSSPPRASSQTGLSDRACVRPKAVTPFSGRRDGYGLRRRGERGLGRGSVRGRPARTAPARAEGGGSGCWQAPSAPLPRCGRRARRREAAEVGFPWQLGRLDRIEAGPAQRALSGRVRQWVDRGRGPLEDTPPSLPGCARAAPAADRGPLPQLTAGWATAEPRPFFRATPTSPLSPLPGHALRRRAPFLSHASPEPRPPAFGLRRPRSPPCGVSRSSSPAPAAVPPGPRPGFAGRRVLVPRAARKPALRGSDRRRRVRLRRRGPDEDVRRGRGRPCFCGEAPLAGLAAPPEQGAPVRAGSPGPSRARPPVLRDGRRGRTSRVSAGDARVRPRLVREEPFVWGVVWSVRDGRTWSEEGHAPQVTL